MIRPTLTLATLATLAALCAPAPSSAQMMHPGGPRFGPPPFMKHLYPPRLVMRSQEKVSLTEAQRTAITDAIAETRKTLADLEGKRAAAATTLDGALAAPHVDESDALAKATALITIEQEIKRAHLRLLIRVKNQLTAEQQTTLDGLRGEWQSDRRQRLRDRLGAGGPAGPDAR